MNTGEKMFKPSGLIASPAFAAFAVSRAEVAAEDLGFCPAIATAQPTDFATTVTTRLGNNDESSKALTDEVNLGGHLESILSGVTGRDARHVAVPSFYAKEAA